MKVRKFGSALAVGIVTLVGGALTHLTAQAPSNQAPPGQAILAPVLFKTYQAGVREAQWTNKPLFVVFRCER